MTDPRVLAVIPARLNSKRFPDKVIHLFQGRPLIYYVYSQVCRSRLVHRVVVATDSQEIQRAITSLGGEVILTSKRHQTGSDRVAEAAAKVGGDIVINVQADVFGLKPSVLDRVVGRFKHNPALDYATLARPVASDAELENPNIVKVAASKNGYALWFSRCPIPFLQHADDRNKTSQFEFMAHIGVYFFRRRSLADFARWPRSPLEKAESLEQLRILEHGRQIGVFKTSMRPVSVDRPQDLKRLTTLYG